MSQGKDVFTFIWRIENFSMCPHEKGDVLRSPYFMVNALDKTTWRLWFYPSGDKLSNGDSASCYLYRTNNADEPEEVTIFFRIALGWAGMEPLKMPAKNAIAKNAAIGFRNFFTLTALREHKNTYYPNDVLTLICCMTRGTESSETPTESVNVSTTLLDAARSMREISTLISDIDVSTEQHLDQCFAYTHIPVHTRRIKWVIKNFKEQMQTDKKITVSVESALRKKSLLLLHCYRTGDWESNGSLNIDIQRKDMNFKKMLVKCKVSVLDAQEVFQETQEDTHLFGEDYEVWSLPPIVKLSTIKDREAQLLDSGVLTLQCEFLISHEGEDVTVSDASFQQNRPSGSDDLRVDVVKLLNNRDLMDVTLISEGIEMLVHKSIICARSPVFKAMFTGDTEEKRSGVVHITDIDSDTLKHMVYFMYDDMYREWEPEKAFKLYSAADKYQLLNLKRKCSAVFKYNLSLSNVCDILVLADMHQDTELLTFVSSFMKIHSKEVFKSNEWNELMKENLPLAAKVMKEVLTD